jgi:hypothetical protein
MLHKPAVQHSMPPCWQPGDERFAVEASQVFSLPVEVVRWG